MASSDKKSCAPHVNERILSRILAKPMDLAALFRDPEKARRGIVDFSDLGTTCTDANGEEDSG